MASGQRRSAVMAGIRSKKSVFRRRVSGFGKSSTCQLVEDTDLNGSMSALPCSQQLRFQTAANA